jgi:hypothetical protein
MSSKERKSRILNLQIMYPDQHSENTLFDLEDLPTQFDWKNKWLKGIVK